MGFLFLPYRPGKVDADFLGMVAGFGICLSSVITLIVRSFSCDHL
jgi:hypothetical protein